MRRLTALFAIILVSCTSGGSPAPRDSPSRQPGFSPDGQLVIPVVASTSGETSAEDGTFLEGMSLAEAQVNSARGVGGRLLSLEIIDDEGAHRGTISALSDVLDTDPPAVLVVGNEIAPHALRTRIEETATPVVLLGGDLYTSRAMFRYVFQTSIPIRWQARVIARYFVKDRRYERLGVIEGPPTIAPAPAPFDEAVEEEGGFVGYGNVISGPGTEPGAVAQAENEDAVAVLARTPEAAKVSAAARRQGLEIQLAFSADALQPSFVARNRPPAGTVACYVYTWSGWAGMLPRVHTFREEFAEMFDHYPAGLEQEGYDAVMALADALVRTDGEGGDRLVQELETFRKETYSSVPVRLGPDDHVFAEESHMGLFAIEEPVGAALPPGEASSLLPWRPIMRTFTTDGERVNLLDRDKPIFFPFWHQKRPTPYYWRSEYGIVSRPSDPLH